MAQNMARAITSRAKTALSGLFTLPNPSARAVMRGGVYDGAASNSKVLDGFNAHLTPPEPAGAGYERDTLVARTRDLENNDPLARSAIEKRIDNVIGAGWGFTSKPNYKALGITFEASIDFAQQVETLWETHITDPMMRFTMEEDMTFRASLGLAYRCGYRDGETFALLPFDDASGTAKFGLRMQLVDADRVTNPNNAMDTKTLKRGIAISEIGRPLGVHIREGHPNDFAMWGKSNAWKYVNLRTPIGRPNIIHYKQTTRPGQLRGVSRLAPVIKSLRAANVFDDAELQSKVTNALFTAVITSNYDVATAGEVVTAEELTKLETERLEFYKANPSARKNPMGGRYQILPSGDTISPVDTNRDTGEDFVDRVLHNIAAGAGLSFEQLTMNWSKVNYSSARAAILEVQKNIFRDQEEFAESFLGQYFFAWMDEAFARGYLKPPSGAPDFWDAPAAYCRVKWIFPAQGWVDPTKEVLAAGMRMNLNLSTLEDECGRQGKNWLDVLRQKARELREMEALGLPVMDHALAMSTNLREDKSEGREHDPNDHLRET